MGEIYVTPQTLDQLVGNYVAIRDQVRAMKERHSNELAPYEQALAGLENYFLTMLNDTGQNSMAGPSGTFYRTVDTEVKIDDWAATLTYIVQTGAWHLLSKRISKAVIADLIKSGAPLPPGVSAQQSYSVNVNRPRGGHQE